MDPFIKNISLPADRFSDTQLSSLTLKNILFGKNGAGKTTITNQIRNMDKSIFDIHIFDGWQDIISESSTEDGLDPILLIGTDNVNIQKINKRLKFQLKEIDNEIAKYDNTFNEKCALLNKHTKLLQKQYKDSATDIYNKLPGLSRNFNRTSFEQYYENGPKTKDLLSQEEEAKYLKIFSEETKTIQNYIKNNKLDNTSLFDFDNIYRKLKQVLSKEILSESSIKFDSEEEEEWVNQGIKLTISNHENPITCLFCNQQIPDNRIDLLKGFFNKELAKLEKDIDELKAELEQKQNIINNVLPIQSNDVYIQFDAQASKINNDFRLLSQSSLNFISKSLDLLNQKNKHKFSSIEINNIQAPKWSTFLSDISELNSQIQKYSNNIDTKRKQAKELLKFHYMYKSISKKEIIEQNNTISSLNREIKTLEDKIDEKSKIRTDLKENIDENLKNYSSEYEIVKKINKYLLSVGIESFSLEYVKTTEYEAYKVAGYDKKIRSINQLSDGEKNLIAFLWFVNKIKSVRETSEKGQVIVFDDPINSNDDRIQYLVIAILRELMSKATQNRSQFFILTHNIHFYMQIIVGQKRYNSEKHFKFFIIEKTGNYRSKIKTIKKKADDIQSVYDTLWDELIFSYENNKAFFMFNIMRRILEAYGSFMFPSNGIADLPNKINDEQERIIYNSFLHMLHNGSHDTGEVDIAKFGLGNNDVDKLMRLFKDVFYSIGEESKVHFDQHKKHAQDSYTS